MNKKTLLALIAALTAAQCKQLGVTAPFKGRPTLKAVEAWLGDSELKDSEGEVLDLAVIFEEGDPASIMLHSGDPSTEEDPEAEPTAGEEQLAKMVGKALAKALDALDLGKKAAMPLVNIANLPPMRNAKNFKNRVDQIIAGKSLAAHFWNSSRAAKWLKDNASGLKDHNIGTDADGGYLAPAPLAQAIIDVREEAGVARRVSRVLPMTANTLDIPKRTSGLTVYYPGEATSVTESTKVWGTIAAVAIKRATLVLYSSELGDDAIVSIADDLSDESGRALALREDTEWIQGDGGAGFGTVSGLDTVAATNVVMGAGLTTWSDVTIKHLTDMIGTLTDKYHFDASWVFSRAFWGQVPLRLMAAAGGNTIAALEAGSNRQTFLGYPINFSDQAPVSTGVAQESAWFGNWRAASVLSDRQGIRLASSEHINFKEDQVAIRATSRYDLNVHDTSAYVGLITAAV